MSGTQESETIAANFTLDVAPLRDEVKAVLESESAQSAVTFSDDGITMHKGGTWNATVWRPGENGGRIEINCTRGTKGRWKVAMVPLNPQREMYVLHWPSPQFEDTLRAAVSDLG